jgi:hypothetical protein
MIARIWRRFGGGRLAGHWKPVYIGKVNSHFLFGSAKRPTSRKGAKPPAAVWLEENREALAASNAWVEANGLPLAGNRRF